MITLKHLARDFKLDPYSLRMALRASELKPEMNGRWKWESAEEPGYIQAQKVARILSSRLSLISRSTSGSDEDSQTAPSPSNKSVRRVSAVPPASRSKS